MNKWDRPVGRRMKLDREPNQPGGKNRCSWHRTGKPSWWTGRFFLAGCPECEAKAALDQTLRSELSPERCFVAYRQGKHLANIRTAARIERVIAARVVTGC